jgi:hypothetical protein
VPPPLPPARPRTPEPRAYPRTEPWAISSAVHCSRTSHSVSCETRKRDRRGKFGRSDFMPSPRPSVCLRQVHQHCASLTSPALFRREPLTSFDLLGIRRRLGPLAPSRRDGYTTSRQHAYSLYRTLQQMAQALLLANLNRSCRYQATNWLPIDVSRSSSEMRSFHGTQSREDLQCLGNPLCKQHLEIKPAPRWSPGAKKNRASRPSGLELPLPPAHVKWRTLRRRRRANGTVELLRRRHTSIAAGSTARTAQH